MSSWTYAKRAELCLACQAPEAEIREIKAVDREWRSRVLSGRGESLLGRLEVVGWSYGAYISLLQHISPATQNIKIEFRSSSAQKQTLDCRMVVGFQTPSNGNALSIRQLLTKFEADWSVFGHLEHDRLILNHSETGSCRFVPRSMLKLEISETKSLRMVLAIRNLNKKVFTWIVWAKISNFTLIFDLDCLWL